MDHIFIKEEVEDTCDAESVSSASESFSMYNSPSYSSAYSNPVSKTSSASIPPTQRVLPSKINHEAILISKPHCLKRKGPELDPSKFKHPRAKFHIPAKPNKLPGYQQKGGGCSNAQDVGSQEKY